RPKAMPEFSTRWMESGPITRDDSSRASLLVTTCLVNWSPTTAAATTAARPAHCHGPAASDRSATETGARAFVDEPTRRSGRGAEPGGGAGVSPTIRQPLVVDAERRRRTREKALATDGLSAALTRSVRPGIEPCERPVDSRERLLGALF